MNSNLIFYNDDSENIHIEALFEDENIWLTQAQIVDLYQTSKSNVSEHIKHIFEDGELNEDSVVRNIRITASDGKNYNTKHYNLDLILSVGYRIKSKIATQFRIWATELIKEYLKKGIHRLTLDFNKLVSGSYYLGFSTKNNIESFTIFQIIN